MPRCGKCGKEFDSERGLKVHNAQVHDDDAEVLETKKEASLGNVTFRLNIRHALVLAFAVGLVTGGFFSLMALQLGGATGFVTAGDNTQPSSDGGPSTIEMKTTNLPYDAETRKGSGEISWDSGTVSLENEPVIGDSGAPVTLVTYEDFFCRYCGRHNRKTVPQVMDSLVSSGDVRYVYKNFPVVGGTKPAVASECVLNQDSEAFWIFKNALYEQQKELMGLMKEDKELFDETMKQWANTLGLDVQKFEQCYSNQETSRKVNSDGQEARKFGASGTPTYVINGKKVVGACPFSTIQKAVQAEQAGEDWEIVNCEFVQNS